MKDLRVGDKVFVMHGNTRSQGFDITPRMRSLEGKVLTVMQINHDYRVIVYYLMETGALTGWVREWLTPITELTIDDLINAKNIYEEA